MRDTRCLNVGRNLRCRYSAFHLLLSSFCPHFSASLLWLRPLRSACLASRRFNGPSNPGCGSAALRRLALLISAPALLFNSLVSGPAATNHPSSDKIPSTRDFTDIRREVETLRGKKFLHDVPVYKISKKELRAISDRELGKEFPGPKLG